MAFGQRYAVVLDVVRAAAFNLGDLVGGAGEVRDQSAPIKIAVADAGEGAVAFLGELVKLCGEGGGGVPRIERLFAGGDGVHAVLCADGENVLKLCYGAAGGYDAHVGLELADARVGSRRVFYLDADGREAVADDFGDVFADMVLVAAECADQLAVMLDHIAHEIAAHLAGSVLYYSDFAFHNYSLLQI